MQDLVGPRLSRLGQPRAGHEVYLPGEDSEDDQSSYGVPLDIETPPDTGLHQPVESLIEDSSPRDVGSALDFESHLDDGSIQGDEMPQSDGAHRQDDTDHHQSDDSHQSNDMAWRDPWFKLVEEYTSRKLTIDQDKLPALAGLAATIARKTGDAYFAGLWKSSFLGGLNWSVDVREPSHHCEDPGHDAALPPPSKSAVRWPSHYRAPSWSWASFDAKLKYGLLEQTGQALATVLDVGIAVEKNNPYGRVKGGFMKVKVCTTCCG